MFVNRFHPLTGKLVLITVSRSSQSREMVSGFRPLTGKLVLIIKTVTQGKAAKTSKFPSPYGEVGFDPCRPESLFSATHSGFCGADDEIRFFSVLI